MPPHGKHKCDYTAITLSYGYLVRRENIMSDTYPKGAETRIVVSWRGNSLVASGLKAIVVTGPNNVDLLMCVMVK